MGSSVFGSVESYSAVPSHYISSRSTKVQRKTFTLRSSDRVVPFLLWHLGSPANFTAYSLEDNELWLRHFLGLVSNGAEAVYIYFKFRTVGVPIFGSLHYLDVMVVPLLVGGILKYAERIVALRSACSEQLRSDLYSEAEDNQLKSEGREMVRTGMYESAGTVKQLVGDPQVKFLLEARMSFEIFRPLFLDPPFKVSRKYLDENVHLKDRSAKDAFRLNNIGASKRDIEGVDIAVTYLLLVGAILLDVLAALLHLWSYWTMTGFGIAGGKLDKLYHWLVASRLRSIKSMAGTPKIAQYDVLKDFCSKPRIGIFSGLINLIGTNELRNKYRIITWVEVDHYLEEFIYTGLERERLNSLVSQEIGRPVRSSSCRISNILSDYMLYLALEVLDATAANKFFTTGLLAIEDPELLCFEVNDGCLTQVEDPEPNVLLRGQNVAQQLRRLSVLLRYDYDDIWEILSDIWMKMLVNAAKYCLWKEHALALRQGRELLTYVSLLLVHFGLRLY
ncbi:hypothetical protein J1N35_006030 [Gossypium stocksii]|uniref:DUF4220 domain-containing protein n=1 Tax=Gossypium stocksii TaxID=47602 RepID=A0A9D4AJT4_9ROSI|nr:hypothetical protein J1N35_006030 [Gossypium stocksii]